MHHVAFDGESTGVLMSELSAQYAADGALQPPLPVQYVDYALWQRNSLVEALAEQRSYWGRVLREGSLPELELPLDLPRPTTQTFNGGMVSVSVAAEKMVRAAHNITCFEMMRARHS